MCTYLRFCCCFPPNSRMLNLRHYFTKKKKVSISPCLLRLSFNKATERILNFKQLLKPVLIPYITLSSRSKPHRYTPVTTTNMKNRTFLCTGTISLHSEFLVILQFRITLGSGNTVQHLFFHFLFIQQQLERWPCSFVKDFWTEIWKATCLQTLLSIHPSPLQ